MTLVLFCSLQYFAWVFTVGFALGVLRVTFLVALLGERWAEIVEMPIMLAVSFLVTRGLIRKHAANLDALQALAIGLIALTLLIAVEFTVVLGLRDLSLSGYLQTRDPISGSIYAVALIVFGLLPLGMFLFERKRHN